MTTSPQPPTTVRKVVVEVVDARDLLPKDGQGSSSPYVMAEFDGQRKRTTTRFKEMNPVWNEAIEFIVSDPDNMEFEELEIELFNDKKYGNGVGRKNQFLGRVKLYGAQFARRGQESLVYFALERKSMFSWVRGEIGLKIYYYDELIQEQTIPQQQLTVTEQDWTKTKTKMKTKTKSPPIVMVEEERVSEDPGPIEHGVPEEHSQLPPVVATEEEKEEEESTPQVFNLPEDQLLPETAGETVSEIQYPPEVKILEAIRMQGDRARNSNKPNGGDYTRRAASARTAGEASQRVPRRDFVEPMQYLFVRIIKARGLAHNDNPYVKIRTPRRFVRSKPASYRPKDRRDSPEWNQVFALGYNADSRNANLEISVWDSPTEKFLGGVCFDLSDVPVRNTPRSPVASQWYHLEAGAFGQGSTKIAGDIQLSIWIGNRSDDAFPEARSSDVPYLAHTRPKVYQSPKLWYLRVNVIEARDLNITPNLPPSTPPDIRVKIQLGFQSARTTRGSMMNRSSISFHWNEDLLFVAGEPLEDPVILLVEARTGNEFGLLSHTVMPLSSIERRIDERHVAPKWFNLEGGSYSGRVYLRLCLEGGYHVLDEAAHVCSDFRPTEKQLWKPPIGILELGILGAHSLLPMKTKGAGKGSTDAYCVAKYGKKWVRTRTITDSCDPRWNEQYTWQVYDPCTVLTVGVFDNWRMFADVSEDKPDGRMGKVRIRISTMESNKIYTNSYPLMVLSRTGLKKMGEIELAVRFTYTSILPDRFRVYGQPLLPRMHYIRPIGVAQQEVLRGAATKMVIQSMSRADPPLGHEVVRYMLDSDSHNWSMRKSKANWFRIVGILAWAFGLTKWLDNIKRWRNPTKTMFFHLIYIVLVCYPDLIVPFVFLYVVLIGIWCYRFKPKIPAGMDTRMSQADTVDPDELDEEFDTIPSSKPPDVVRIRYDRLRLVSARVQKVLGDLATQGERVQALMSWRDPRATKLFIGVCLVIAMIMFVVPTKMVAVAVGFYYLRHPMFRDPMPPASLNFFRRLPSMSDRLM
ncbi:protein QUIRKY-like [Prosopis cineraria]|uniref:protein QUIRKY-like n=1 Tax=Prosopis cineraria TaxID=364024 RepID=UPI00241009CF|nr:protein QUIRKY-like [Prosopis cineraria]